MRLADVKLRRDVIARFRLVVRYWLVFDVLNVCKLEEIIKYRYSCLLLTLTATRQCKHYNKVSMYSYMHMCVCVHRIIKNVNMHWS